MAELMTAEATEELPQDKSKDIVGFWTFLGLALLFAIPVIGWIACAVMMFVPKRRSLKNYARASMVWIIVGILLVVAVYFALQAVENYVIQFINESMGSHLESVNDVIGLVGQVMGGDYSGVMDQFGDALVEQFTGAFGEEYAPLLQELVNGEYTELLTQLQNEQYTEILQELQNGQYDDLINTVDSTTYQTIVDELKAAADGDPSELLEELKNFVPQLP